MIVAAEIVSAVAAGKPVGETTTAALAFGTTAAVTNGLAAELDSGQCGAGSTAAVVVMSKTDEAIPKIDEKALRPWKIASGRNSSRHNLAARPPDPRVAIVPVSTPTRPRSLQT